MQPQINIDGMQCDAVSYEIAGLREGLKQLTLHEIQARVQELKNLVCEVGVDETQCREMIDVLSMHEFASDNYKDSKLRLLVKELIIALDATNGMAGQAMSDLAMQYLAQLKSVHDKGFSVNSPIDESTLKPGNYAAMRDPSFLAYWLFACIFMTGAQIELVWHEMYPILLMFLDDSDVSIKAKGVSMLGAILPKVNRAFLSRSGLDRLFWDRMLGCLTFLPPLVEESASLSLLTATFDVLDIFMMLESSNAPYWPREECRSDCLRSIVADGLFSGLRHIGNSTRMVEFYTHQVGALSKQYGIAICKYLRVRQKLQSRLT